MPPLYSLPTEFLKTYKCLFFLKILSSKKQMLTRTAFQVRAGFWAFRGSVYPTPHQAGGSIYRDTQNNMEEGGSNREANYERVVYSQEKNTAV